MRIVQIIMFMLACITAMPGLALAADDDDLPAMSCESNGHDAVILNYSGFDVRTWGHLRLSVSTADLCNVDLFASWGDSEVLALHAELERLLVNYDRIVLVGYSMSAPYVLEAMDTWPLAKSKPEVLDRLDLVLVAPVAGVAPGLRGFVAARAEVWTHAWEMHFVNGLMARNHIYEVNRLLDRTSLILAGKERVVVNDRISKAVRERLDLLVLEDATHVDLRFRNEVSAVVERLLLRP